MNTDRSPLSSRQSCSPSLSPAARPPSPLPPPAPVGHRTASGAAGSLPGRGRRGWYSGRRLPPHTQRLVLVSPDGGDPHRLQARVAKVLGRVPAARLVGGRAHRPAHHHGAERRQAVRGGRDDRRGPRADRCLGSTGRVLDADGSGVIARSWKRGRSNTLVLDRISGPGRYPAARLDQRRDGARPQRDRAHRRRHEGRVQLLLSTTTGAVVNRFRGPATACPSAGGTPPGCWRPATRPLARRPRDRQHRAADPWAPARSRRLRPPGRS